MLSILMSKIKTVGVFVVVTGLMVPATNFFVGSVNSVLAADNKKDSQNREGVERWRFGKDGKEVLGPNSPETDKQPPPKTPPAQPPKNEEVKKNDEKKSASPVVVQLGNQASANNSNGDEYAKNCIKKINELKNALSCIQLSYDVQLNDKINSIDPFSCHNNGRGDVVLRGSNSESLKPTDLFADPSVKPTKKGKVNSTAKYTTLELFQKFRNDRSCQKSDDDPKTKLARSNCKIANEAFTKAKDRFTLSCKEAQIGSDCQKGVTQCSEALAEAEDEEEKYSQDVANACPAYFSENLDRFKKAFKEEREALEKAEEHAEKNQRTSQNAMNKLQDEVQNLSTQVEQTQRVLLNLKPNAEISFKNNENARMLDMRKAQIEIENFVNLKALKMDEFREKRLAIDMGYRQAVAECSATAKSETMDEFNNMYMSRASRNRQQVGMGISAARSVTDFFNSGGQGSSKNMQQTYLRKLQSCKSEGGFGVSKFGHLTQVQNLEKRLQIDMATIDKQEAQARKTYLLLKEKNDLASAAEASAYLQQRQELISKLNSLISQLQQKQNLLNQESRKSNMDLATDQQKLAQRSLEVERLEAKYKMHEQVAGSSGSTDAGSVMKAISDYNNALSEASTAFKACNCSVCYGNNGEPDYGCPSALAFFANQPGEVKTQLCPNGSDSDSDFSRPTESIRN